MKVVLILALLLMFALPMTAEAGFIGGYQYQGQIRIGGYHHLNPGSYHKHKWYAYFLKKKHRVIRKHRHKLHRSHRHESRKVPEPGTIGLLALGLAGAGVVRMRVRKSDQPA